MGHILPTYKIQESLFVSSSFESLWRVLGKILCNPSLGPVYCIHDGLDECDEPSLETLLKRVKDLYVNQVEKTPSFRFHLILVSRGLPDFIPEILSGFPQIHLDSDSDADIKVDHDLDQYIKIKTTSWLHAKIPEFIACVCCRSPST